MATMTAIRLARPAGIPASRIALRGDHGHTPDGSGNGTDPAPTPFML
ncbi:MAG: hypothetical protein ABGW82_01685 [Paracoccus sp. (in: a-proteobacteria)]|jgi:hypothetical protein|nr:hypothetical protein [Paracoccus sp. (in: a-proteobacteria)]MDB2552623.1 hypothetical protein [Paracoccus sp. (in: a-proteobacteria)]|tara:strand:+ start:361 stop:501 length:141 start_codon:yes stop_codon:yes gene_type:complete